MKRLISFVIIVFLFFFCSSKRLDEVGFLKKLDEVRTTIRSLDNINSSDDEFAYFSVRCGQEIYYTKGNKKYQKLVYRGEGSISDFNIKNNYYGTATSTLDGSLVIFAVGIDKNRSCDLVAYRNTPAGWIEDKNLLKKVNSEYWDGSPFLSPEGDILFFSSTRKGGFGGKDLYYSVLLKDSIFSKPKNIGSIINTKYDEQSPFLTEDKNYIIFSSNGHKRLGGFDFFIAKFDNQLKKFISPVALPKPYNSEYDDLFFFHPIDAKKVYISSNRLGGKGGFDIYEIDKVPYKLATYIVFYGNIYDVKFSNKLSGNIIFKDFKTEKVIGETYTGNIFMEYYFILRELPENIGITVRSDGYLFYTTKIDSKGLLDLVYKKDFFLKDLKSVVDLKVFFEFNSAILKSESFFELNEVVDFLKDYPNVKIELSGHTDNIGSFEYNMKLSLERAEAVKEYLVKHGISEDRIIAKGYGSTIPRASNDTEEGRSKNRRVEFKVISF